MRLLQARIAYERSTMCMLYDLGNSMMYKWKHFNRKEAKNCCEMHSLKQENRTHNL